MRKTNKGRVYWITGLPGSGKTTLGTALYYEIKNYRDNILILDGDILKQMVNDTVGYERQDRYIRAKKYSKICKMLANQGMWVIICTVAMFDEVRTWNRERIDGYIEVFIHAPFDTLYERNKKGLYTNRTSFDDIEFPKEPDIVIESDGLENVGKHVQSILSIIPRRESEYDRDKEYWDNIYRGNTLEVNPSPFALSVLMDMQESGCKEILEIGCGNGRDSLFFVSKDLKVTAVDASEEAIQRIKEKTKGTSGLFICDDFVRCEAVYQVTYDAVYCRWSLHAISERQEDELIQNVAYSLKERGRFYIEARSINDDLYGKGEEVAPDSFVYNGHFRRFIDPEKLVYKLQKCGFSINSIEEGRGFSTTEKQDPVLLRVIAVKHDQK